MGFGEMLERTPSPPEVVPGERRVTALAGVPKGGFSGLHIASGQARKECLGFRAYGVQFLRPIQPHGLPESLDGLGWIVISPVELPEVMQGVGYRRLMPELSL